MTLITECTERNCKNFSIYFIHNCNAHAIKYFIFQKENINKNPFFSSFFKRFDTPLNSGITK